MWIKLTEPETIFYTRRIAQNVFEKPFKNENGDIFLFDKVQKEMIILQKENDRKYNLIVEKNQNKYYGHERYPYIIDLLINLDV